jgi:hypothetical protein
MMKSLRMGFVAASVLTATACTVVPPQVAYTGPTVAVVASRPPPPPRVEIIPAAPGREYVWLPGYWHWERNDHRWVDGRWDRQRERERWVPHRWDHDDRGGQWHLHGGYWHRD